MLKTKETPYYKKYYLFGKCIWKHTKPIKRISEYLLSIVDSLNSDIKRNIAELNTEISKLKDDIAITYEKSNYIKITDKKVFCDGLWLIEDWGGWIKNSANIYLTFDRNNTTDVQLRIGVSKIPTETQKQELIVFVNNEYNTTFTTDKSIDELVVTIPYTVLIACNFKIIVSFFATNQLSPMELGMSKDERKLSYGLVSISSSVAMVLSSFDTKNSYQMYKTACYQEEWEEYIKHEMDGEKIKKLCKDLPIESIDIIKTLLYRRQNEYRFSVDELYQKYLVHHNDISKYKIVNKYGFQPEVFYFKNGLRFLDNDIIKKCLSKGAIIDGGACSGDSTLMFAEYDFVKKIYAFEPVSNICKDMAKTLEINGCTKAEAVNAGLSDTDGFADIMNEKCKTITIDSFAKDKTISCIKLDIEGMEYGVIKSALETIKRDKPLLLICLYHKPKDFFEIKPLIESLNLGYKFKIADTEPCNSLCGCHAVLIGYVP